MSYKETVFLPRTDFPMRGGLPKKEPEILAQWQQIEERQQKVVDYLNGKKRVHFQADNGTDLHVTVEPRRPIAELSRVAAFSAGAVGASAAGMAVLKATPSVAAVVGAHVFEPSSDVAQVGEGAPHLATVVDFAGGGVLSHVQKVSQS